jgi:flagellar biosynthesis/type III secretory pathway M-ring protein FliF/YscJ
MTPLFTDLSYEDSSAIVKDLERQGVAYELRNDGGTIIVPKDPQSCALALNVSSTVTATSAVGTTPTSRDVLY